MRLDASDKRINQRLRSARDMPELFLHQGRARAANALDAGRKPRRADNICVLKELLVKQPLPHFLVAGITEPCPKPVRRRHVFRGAPCLALGAPERHQPIAELLDQVEVRIHQKRDRIAPWVKLVPGEISHARVFPDNAVCQTKLVQQFQCVVIRQAHEMVEALKGHALKIKVRRHASRYRSGLERQRGCASFRRAVGR